MKKVGIALGGGGAKGLSHILMLEVIDEFGIKPHRIAGTSIGAIAGVLYASGLSGKAIKENIEQMSITEGDSLSDIFTKKDVFKWLKFIDISWKDGGLLKADTFLDNLMERVKVKDFEQLSIPLSVVAADFWKRDQIVFHIGDIRTAVHASMAIPGIFDPVVNGKQVFVDGGVVNPVPYDLLLDDCDLTIAIDVMGNRTESADLIPSLSESIFNSFQIMQKSILRQKVAACPPDIYIAPDIVDIQMLEFYKAEEIFKQAQSAADELRKALEKQLQGGSHTRA
jgi:NTE family protein